jgi:hypothetical protein
MIYKDMINKDELKVGSLVQDYSGRIYRLSYMDVTFFNEKEGNFIPVLLDKKILVKCFFTEEETNDFFDVYCLLFRKVEKIKKQTQIQSQKFLLKKYKKDNFYIYGGAFKLQYLHELQNLYFALALQQLKIEL